MHERYFEKAKEFVDGLPEGCGISSSEIFLPSVWSGGEWDLSRYSEKQVWNLKNYEQQIEKYIGSGNEAKYSLVAFSNAGYPALNVALNNPEKIDRLIFCDSVLDPRYNPQGRRILINVLGRMPPMLKEIIGGSEFMIRLRLNGDLDSGKVPQAYREIINITKAHGGKNLVDAAYNSYLYASSIGSYCTDNLEKLNKLIEDGKVAVYSINASESGHVKRYLAQAKIPEENRFEIDSRHLITIQKPDAFNEVLAEILCQDS